MNDKHATVRNTTSKLANIHYAKALSERVQDVKIIPVHPGLIATNLHHASTGTFLKPFLNVTVRLAATPVEKGALAQNWTSVSPDAKSGQYYGHFRKEEKGSTLAQNRSLQERLFEWIQKELKGHAEVL